MPKLSGEAFQVPIILIIFNRPEFAKKLIDILRMVKPYAVYVVADGPRSDHPEDDLLCKSTRAVIEQIDWGADVKKLFLESNIGCGKAPADGITWAFSSVEMAIILEDDCLPDLSFFEFCESLLEKYQCDEKVMMISGNNHLLGRTSTHHSYWFSINTQTHGWATWKRAWSLYDFKMADWPKIRRSSLLLNTLHNKRYAKKWKKIFDQVYQLANENPKYDCWDFQWTYACWKNGALNIIPEVNLVSNIGYGKNATHQTPIDHPLANLRGSKIKFPLIHPLAITQDLMADEVLSQNVYNNWPIYYRIYRKLKKVIANILAS